MFYNIRIREDQEPVLFKEHPDGVERLVVGASSQKYMKPRLVYSDGAEEAFSQAAPVNKAALQILEANRDVAEAALLRVRREISVIDSHIEALKGQR